MSFGFRVPEGGDRWPSPDERELHEILVHEISLVGFPAYKSTSVSVALEARAADLTVISFGVYEEIEPEPSEMERERLRLRCELARRLV